MFLQYKLQIFKTMKGAVLSIAYISITLLLSTSGFNITNPPTNVTVCINTVAEINCGFTGTDPKFVTPNWRIVMRSNNGSIVSNETSDGSDIVADRVSGLEWIPDIKSGASNAPNSKLIFGPVNKTHNQSSFQCIFVTSHNEVIAASSVGTITVVGPPSANIIIDEVCITSVTLSLSIYSHSACGGLSHHVNLMVSGRVILPVSNNGSTYTFNGLATNTKHNVTVAYNASDINVFSKPVKTLASKSPNPVDVDTIKVLTTRTNHVKFTWKEPNIDTCLMSKIKFYDVNINYDNGESVSMETNSTVMTFLPSELLNNKSNISCTLTIVVYNSEEMSSQPTTRTFIINNTTNDNDSNSGDDDNDSSNNSSSSSNNIAPIIAGVVIPIVVITIIILIIIVLLYLWCRNSHHHKSNVIDFKKTVEENSYGESHNNNIRIENDSVTAYAISGPSPQMIEDNAQSNTEQLIDNSSLNESPPTLPPKINYAKLDIRDNVPKAVKVDKEVQYAETKPV